MRLASKESVSAPPKVRDRQQGSAKAQEQTTPQQIWQRLSQVQQEQVFQRLVMICRQVLNDRTQVGPEVNDEDT